LHPQLQTRLDVQVGNLSLKKDYQDAVCVYTKILIHLKNTVTKTNNCASFFPVCLLTFFSCMDKDIIRELPVSFYYFHLLKMKKKLFA
jgi:hypothetical protein